MDRLEKARKEVEKLHGNPYYMMAIKDVLEILDIQEEPVKDRFAFKAIPRLLDMIEPSDRAKAYIAKLADTLEVEGYSTDAKIVMESLKIMNGEKVPMATMDEEPVSENLFEASAEYAATGEILANGKEMIDFQKQKAFRAGAKWQRQKDEHLIWQTSTANYEKGIEEGKQQMMKNIWKTADGDDLPEYEREVVVLTQPYPLENSEYAVYFAHRPNPDGWDGKSIVTEKTEHYTPKTYDKGGWNIPDVKFWLDVKLPKEIEEL